MATGENLFSHQDARNLLRYGGMRPDRDWLQFDCALSYGLCEYQRTLAVLTEFGWSWRRCIPHGGHQMSLMIAAGLGLGGNESYPDVFQPYGGFPDGVRVEDGGERRGAGEQPAPVVGEARQRVPRHGDERTVARARAREQHTGFLERLTHRRDPEPAVLTEDTVVGVDGPAGKHVRATREHGLGIAPQHEHLEAVLAVAQQHHGGRRPDRDVVAHRRHRNGRLASGSCSCGWISR